MALSPPGALPAHGDGGPETGTSEHPRVQGIERIRVSLHRPADGTRDILVVWDDGQEDRPAGGLRR